MVTPVTFRTTFSIRKTRAPVLSWLLFCVITTLAVLIEHWFLWTEGHTDGHRHRIIVYSVYCASIASRVNNDGSDFCNITLRCASRNYMRICLSNKKDEDGDGETPDGPPPTGKPPPTTVA